MNPTLDISSQVDHSEITIGDRVHYEIKVVYPKDGNLVLPSVLGNLGSFEVKDYQASEPKDAGNLKIQTWRFDLSTFTVGKYTIPPQIIEYREGKDTTARIFYTQPIELNVKRTSPETVKDIADIAPLAQVSAPTPWLLYGLGGFIALALAAVLWRLLRKKTPTVAAKPQLPPFEEALAGLAGLKDLSLIRQNRAREFCFDLSEILRRYVSRRFGVDALESTTSEFLEKARHLPVTAAQKQWLAEFCDKTDVVKFANAMMLESDAGALLSATEAFVRQTRPREDESVAATEAQRTAAQKGLEPKTAPSKAAPSKAGGPAKPGSRPKPASGGGLIQGGHGHEDHDRGGKP
ncbi:MAG: hypothetical protein JF616_17340 [Fibrobacteres bacterium]|nr:hypothetical protein [Fibrobacterota bacterium]